MIYLRGIHGYKTHGLTKKLANKHGVHRMYAWNGLDTPTCRYSNFGEAGICCSLITDF